MSGKTNLERIECPCGKHVTIESTSNVGETADRSGYWPLFTNGGGLEYLCPSCKERVVGAVEIIIDVLGPERASHMHMLRPVLDIMGPGWKPG